MNTTKNVGMSRVMALVMLLGIIVGSVALAARPRTDSGGGGGSSFTSNVSTTGALQSSAPDGQFWLQHTAGSATSSGFVSSASGYESYQANSTFILDLSSGGIVSRAIVSVGTDLYFGGIGNSFGTRLISKTAPTISSGFGTSPSVTASNTSAAFRVNVGTGGVASSGVIGLPVASTGWNCWCNDITTQSATVDVCKQTSGTTTTVTVGNFTSAGVAGAWAASDVLMLTCFSY